MLHTAYKYSDGLENIFIHKSGRKQSEDNFWFVKMKILSNFLLILSKAHAESFSNESFLNLR